MQREQLLEKQAIGIATAKHANDGRYKGKQQSDATIKSCGEALNLIDKMGYSKTKAAKASGVSVATLYRYIKAKN
jgi:DNA invertase Pin-like site-specific DNA recombinase